MLSVCLSGISSAQLIPTVGKCGTLSMNTLAGGGIRYFYKTPAVFPNPSEKKTLKGNWTTTCGTIQAQSDGSTVKIVSSKSIDDAWSFLDRDGLGFIINEFGYYDYPSIQVGYHHFESRIKLENGVFQASGDNTAQRGRVAGYKVNGGKLQPLLFEGRFHRFKVASTNLLDIYVKSSGATDPSIIFQRLSINPTTKTITIYTKFGFPSQ